MAKLEDLTVQVNVEGLLQKALTEVINKIHDDHGVMIERIDFDWVRMSDGKGKVLSCRTQSNYYT